MIQQKQRPADYCEEERYCPGCDEWWPADGEFFHKSGHKGLQTYCKACYQQKYNPTAKSWESRGSLEKVCTQSISERV